MQYKEDYKQIFVPSASLILTDYLPAGEGLIAYNLIKFLATGQAVFSVCAPRIRIQNQIKNVNFYEVGHYDFFPAPCEYFYLKNWRLYCEQVSDLYNSLLKQNSFDIIHHFLPVNINQSYTPVKDKPFVIGPVFHPWIDLNDDEYSAAEIVNDDSNFILRKIHNYLKKKWRLENKQKFIDTLEYADKIIVTLDVVKKFLPENVQKKIVKIPIGVDTMLFKPVEQLEDNNIILFLAYIVKRKGLDYLLKAVEIIKRRIPDVKLLIAGDGPDKDYYMKMTNDLHLNETVQFLGNIPHYQTPEIFSRAQIYVLPSLCEPFGMSIIEAMATGLPVIVTNAGGAPEVVGEHNKNFIVPPRDAQTLADKIIELLLDIDKCKTIGKDNREFAVRNYDWRLIAGNYFKLYNKLCE